MDVHATAMGPRIWNLTGMFVDTHVLDLSIMTSSLRVSHCLSKLLSALPFFFVIKNLGEKERHIQRRLASGNFPPVV